MTVSDSVNEYAPTLLFSKGERYFPCNVFFAGKNIVKNKQEYETLTHKQKLDGLFCYYHITEGQRYTTYQYWYYFEKDDFPRLPVMKFGRFDRLSIVATVVSTY